MNGENWLIALDAFKRKERNFYLNGLLNENECIYSYISDVFLKDKQYQRVKTF